MTIDITYHNAPQTNQSFDCECVWNGATPDPDCVSCKGSGEVSFETPHPDHCLNLANANARLILQLVEFPLEDVECLYGSVPFEGIPALIGRTIRALNSHKLRAGYTREPVHIPGGHAGVQVIKDDDGIQRIQRMGATAYVAGYSDDQISDRLAKLLTVLRNAHDAGQTVFCS